MDKLTFAQLFVKMGIAVIPLRHRGKEPESQMMGGTWQKYQTILSTEREITNWLFSGWQNYGVVAGWNNLAILDFDNADAFAMWLDYFAALNKHVEVLPMPFMVRTARGAHVYITLPAGIANSKRRGVDVKIHGYVVGPGSVHPSGAIYAAMNNDMVFPVVWDLETILPSELFPCVAPSVSVRQIECKFEVAPPTTEYAYDPFAAASQQVTDIDLITKVKQAVRIETLFPDAYKTSTDGRWLACKCIFHNDNKPSAWIDTKHQICGCNVCNFKPLDVINLYSRIHNLSNHDAIIALAKIGV